MRRAMALLAFAVLPLAARSAGQTVTFDGKAYFSGVTMATGYVVDTVGGQPGLRVMNRVALTLRLYRVTVGTTIVAQGSLTYTDWTGATIQCGSPIVDWSKVTPSQVEAKFRAVYKTSADTMYMVVKRLPPGASGRSNYTVVLTLMDYRGVAYPGWSARTWTLDGYYVDVWPQ